MTISVRNHQRGVRVDLAWLRRFAPLALAECLKYSADGTFALRAIEEVEVAIVSDRRIARVHRQFMSISGATDVITFQHGEIVMSAEAARRFAGRDGRAVDRELALYTVHGLLHLNGYEDDSTAAAAKMRRLQTAVLKTCLPKITLL